MGKCIFPVVNAWTSKKPIKYWRSFTPKDIPLYDLKQYSVFYYKWDDVANRWGINVLAAIEPTWSIENIRKTVEKHNILIEGGKEETIIVEVRPKYGIGKYKDIEILNIYAENAQFNRVEHSFVIYETEYYIKDKNGVTFVTETLLDNFMQSNVKPNKNCYLYTFTNNKNLNLRIRSRTANSKNEKRVISKMLSTPGLKFNFPHHASFFHNAIDENTWEYKSSVNLTTNHWAAIKDSKPSLERVSNDVKGNWTDFYNASYSFLEFKKYYKDQIAKVESQVVKDDLDLAFLKAVKTNRTKPASFFKVARKRAVITPYKNNYPKNSQIKKEKDKPVYIIYTSTKRIVTKKKEPILVSTEITKRCQKWQAEKLQDKHPEIRILTIPEYNKLKSELYQKPIKPNDSTINSDGSFNRKIRRMDKQKYKKNSRLVQTQRVYVPLKYVEKHPKLANSPWKNKNGHENKPLFINRNNITGSVIKADGQLIPTDSVKIINHHISQNKSVITKHNLNKQIDRVPKNSSYLENKTYKHVLLKELKSIYAINDRRYTVNSKIETWSTQFFIVLKMVQKKERRKKVLNYLINTCGYSIEFAKGFYEYLQLTRYGDPTREHKRNQPTLYKRTMITKPHVQVNSPSPQHALVIEHEVTNAEEGGVKNIITEDVYVRYSKKIGLRFIHYNSETNEQTLVATAQTIKRWAYVQEYKDNPDKVKWNELLIVTTKQVPVVEKENFHINKKVNSSRVKKWSTTIPLDKTVRYTIKKLNAAYRSGQHDLVYSIIKNKIMEDYEKDSKLYDAVRYSLYHNYSNLGKCITTMIKADKMNDPDLVVFIEDRNHPHFN